MVRSNGPALPIAAIVALGLAAWWPAASGGFVWDDHSLVDGNPLLRGPIWRLWFTAASTDYWPLTWTSFWIEWRLWGAAPAGYHVTNVVLHLVVALLVWQVLRALRVPGAAVAGLLFAVHPVGAETVAWISERKNTLSAVFALLSVLVWLRAGEGRSARARAVSLVLFALALLAKSSVVAIPCVLLGIAWFRRGRVGRTDLVRTAPFFALSIAAGVVTIWFQHEKALGGASSSPGIFERLGGAAWALVSYQQKAFVPVDLGIVYPPWPVEADTLAFAAPAVALAAALAGLWAVRGRPWGRALVAGVAYHALLVAPVLGLVGMAYFFTGPVSNHLQYLALVAPAALCGAALAVVTRRLPPVLAGAVVLVPAALLAFVSNHRAGAFASDLALWTRAAQEQPRSAVARFQLAQLLLDEGRRDEALAELDAAARLTPDEGLRHDALAQRHLQAGDREAARAEAVRLLRVTSTPNLRRDAALVLLATGAETEAVAELESLVRRMPASPDFAYWLAVARARTGGPDEAMDVLRRFAAERPGVPRVEEALAFMLVRSGRREEALERAAAVWAVAPSDARAREQFARWSSQPGWGTGQ